MHFIEKTIDNYDANQTLIKFLQKTYCDFSSIFFYKLIRTKKILVNGKKTIAKYQLQKNDKITIFEKKLFEIKKVKVEQSKNLSDPLIVYEDDNLVIADKDHNVVIHSPESWNLDNMVRSYLQKKNIQDVGTFKISHLHRLDKLTRGLVIYPLNKIAYNILAKSWAEKDKIQKSYFAIISGVFTQKKKLSGFIYKDENKQKMVFSEKKIKTQKSYNCETEFELIYTNKKYSLIHCVLLTGRKHQIRASLEYLQHPIVGDDKYGSFINIKNKIMLFANEIAFYNLEMPLSYLNGKKIFLNLNKQKLIEIINLEKW